LNETHFDLVAGHFAGTLRQLGVAPELIDEAIGVIAPLRPVFEEGAMKYGTDPYLAVEEEKQEESRPLGERMPSLLDRLGGAPAVKAVVTEFYERLLADIDLYPFFANTNMSALKMHQIKFMQIAFTHIPDDLDVAALMRDKHSKLFEDGLNETHFDKVAGHLVAALQDLGVSQDLIDEAIAVICPLRPVFEQGALEAAERKALP
jgi:hemoglobin